MISLREADTKKYCCLSLSIFPSSVESLGYSTLEISSALFFSLTASAYISLLKISKSNSFKLSAFHNLRVLTFLVSYPIIGVSYGTALTFSPANSTITVSSSRLSDQGSPYLSQLSPSSL